jgi:hypothetical protein
MVRTARVKALSVLRNLVSVDDDFRDEERKRKTVAAMQAVVRRESAARTRRLRLVRVLLAVALALALGGAVCVYRSSHAAEALPIHHPL